MLGSPLQCSSSVPLLHALVPYVPNPVARDHLACRLLGAQVTTTFAMHACGTPTATHFETAVHSTALKAKLPKTSYYID